MADGANAIPGNGPNNGASDGADRTPYSLEAEQAILGAILFDNEIYYRVSTFLKSEHFYDPVHQLIFDACGSLINQGRLASPVMVDASLAAAPPP